MLGRNILAVYPHRRRSSETRYAPPMGLEYVCAAVKDLVESITIVDMRLEKDYDLAPFITEDVDSVCISLNWPPGNPEGGVVPEFDLINRIPPHLFTVVGGRWATLNTERVFQDCPNVDVIVQGDGEETIRDLVSAGDSSLPLGTGLSRIEGIAFRSNGEIRRTPPRRFAPLSETVYPDRSLRRYEYRVAARGIDFGVRMDTVLTSRGCPFHCKFCAYNADHLGRRRPWEPRSPESVLAELRTIDAETVFIADNNFCVDMDRVAKICDLVMAEGIRKTFALEARIDIARRPDVLAKMARAGFRLIMFGIESASDESLDILNKGFTVQQARDAFDVLRRYRFALGGFFIIGNISETERDMRRIAPFARELGVHFISLSYLRADPGSALEEVVAEHPGYHIAPEKRYRVYSDRHSLRDLRRVKRAVTRDFYLNGYLLKTVGRLALSGVVQPRHLWRIASSVAIVLGKKLLPRRLRSRIAAPGGLE